MHHATLGVQHSLPLLITWRQRILGKLHGNLLLAVASGLSVSSLKSLSFNIYNINYTCRTIPNEVNVAKYLNLPEVRAAIHAPNKTLSACNSTILEALSFENVVPPAYSILPNIIEQHIPIHLYSGDYDFIVNNVGTEVVIQNMTW